MSTPNHFQTKNTRFTDKNQVFQYTGTKSNGEDDQWLLSSPIEIDKKNNNRFHNQQKEQQQYMQQVAPTEIKMDIQVPKPNEADDYINVLRQYEQHMNSFNKLQAGKQEISNSRYEVQQKERQRQKQEMVKLKEQQQLKRKRDQQLLQQQQRLFAQAEKMKEMEKIARDKKNEPIQPKAQTQNIVETQDQNQKEDKKKKPRVTLNFNQWLKDVQANEAPIKQQKQQKSRNSIHFNNRITMDLKGISALLQDNYNKYETIMSNKSKQAVGRTSLGRKSISVRNSNNNLIIEQYIQRLQYEDPQEQQEQKFYIHAQEQTSKRLKASQFKIAKLQAEINGLQEQLLSLPDQSEEERLNIEQYERMLQPLKRLSYKYSIDVLSFQTNQHDPYAVYCEFILDNNIFCKLKREGHSKKAQIRLAYSGILDIVPNTDILIDMNSRLQLLKIFFTTYLQNLKPYQILQQMGIYYDQFKILEDDLSRCCSIFAVKSMELSRSCENITFQLSISPQTTILVTIKLLNLLKKDYYEFYHIQARKEIVIAENSLKGDDFIDIIEALLLSVS